VGEYAREQHGKPDESGNDSAQNVGTRPTAQAGSRCIPNYDNGSTCRTPLQKEAEAPCHKNPPPCLMSPPTPSRCNITSNIMVRHWHGCYRGSRIRPPTMLQRYTQHPVHSRHFKACCRRARRLKCRGCRAWGEGRLCRFLHRITESIRDLFHCLNPSPDASIVEDRWRAVLITP